LKLPKEKSGDLGTAIVGASLKEPKRIDLQKA
jgi:hypothetical protein